MIFQLHTWTLTESRNNWCLNFPGQLRNDPTGAARSVQWRSATCNWREQRLYTKGFNWRRLLECLSLRKLTGPTFSKPPIFKGKVIGQAKLVQATCGGWKRSGPLFSPTFFLFLLSFFCFLSTSAFHPLRVNSHGRKFVSPNILAYKILGNFYFFMKKKNYLRAFFCYSRPR